MPGTWRSKGLDTKIQRVSSSHPQPDFHSIEKGLLTLPLFLFLLWWNILLTFNHPQNFSFLIAKDIVTFFHILITVFRDIG